MDDIVDLLVKMRDRYINEPVIGSKENPYSLIVPGWIEDRCIAQGTTSQAKADELFRYYVKVTVVR